MVCYCPSWGSSFFYLAESSALLRRGHCGRRRNHQHLRGAVRADAETERRQETARVLQRGGGAPTRIETDLDGGRTRSPGKRVANSVASLGGDPEKVPSFCRQKLKFMARADDEMFSIFVCSSPHPPVLVDPNSCWKGLCKVLKGKR